MKKKKVMPERAASGEMVRQVVRRLGKIEERLGAIEELLKMEGEGANNKEEEVKQP